MTGVGYRVVPVNSGGLAIREGLPWHSRSELGRDCVHHANFQACQYKLDAKADYADRRGPHSLVSLYLLGVHCTYSTAL